jgi:hypothetical protein
MTKLEELKAAAWDTYEAANAANAAERAAKAAAYYAAERADDAWVAYKAELKKTQEENPLTKLEEMKAARSARLHGLVKKHNKWKAALKRICRGDLQ